MPYPREMKPLPAGIDPAVAPGLAGKIARMRKALRNRGFFVPRNEREKAEFVLVNGFYRVWPLRVLSRNLWNHALAGMWKGAAAAALLGFALRWTSQAHVGLRLLLLSVATGAVGSAVWLIFGPGRAAPLDPGWSREREYSEVAASDTAPHRWPCQGPGTVLCWPHLILRELAVAIWSAAFVIAAAMLL
ncbi:MAG: hypothetical protein IT209_06095 [Armatimonadetes bacterium]|nr:hypothetical protein [Armatimonadota bacterium]